MTEELPDGWEWSTIGQVADVQLGRQRSPQHHQGEQMRPYLRSANVTWGGVSVEDVNEMNFDDADFEKYRLEIGDLLLNEASGSPNEVGKPAIWNGELEDCCFQNTLLRLRPHSVERDYLYWYCYQAALSGKFGEAGRGVNIRHLGKRGLAQFPVPVAPSDVQQPIVDFVEEHLSRLDAAEAWILSAMNRVSALEQSRIDDLIEGSGPLEPVESFAAGDRRSMAIGPFGSNLKVSDYRDSGVPLVFVRDIRRGTFGGEVTKFVTGEKARELEAHSVVTGDVLVTKMGDPPGDTAVYVGPTAIITADCIKLTPSDSVDAGFVSAALRTRRARAEVLAITKGVAQKKVSLGRFRSKVYLPKPPLVEQQEIALEARAVREATSRLRIELRAALAHADGLRRSVLSAAFSGKLTGMDHSHRVPTEVPERAGS